MAQEDREVLREVWDGRIPAVFNLAEDEMISQESPPSPFYLLLPRMSYLPLATDKVKKYFSTFTEPTDNAPNIWFDYKGIPLKWHHPIGALYDQLRIGSQPEAGGDEGEEQDCLPWQLTIHFQNFPQEDLIPCQSREIVESHFMSCLKEADQLKHGGKVVSTMQKKDHNQLWTGLQNDKFDQFWAINRKFMEPSSGDNFKHIPVRFHIGGNNSVVQKLVKPLRESGCEPVRMEDLHSLCFPNFNTVKFVIQGIEPSPETPVQWLSQHLSYPDNFLHIAVFCS